MELSLSTYLVEGHVVLEVGGALDVHTGPRLREKLIEIVEGGQRWVLLDMSNLEFLDSTGLGIILGAFERCRAVRGSLSLIAPHERTLKMFRITAADRVVPIFDSVRAALDHDPPSPPPAAADAAPPVRKRPARKARSSAATVTSARRPPRTSGPAQPGPPALAAPLPAADADEFTMPSWFDENRLDFFRAVSEAGTMSIADLADVFKISQADVRRILTLIGSEETSSGGADGS